ncbi:MAG: MBL fold metallo-hydrolase [Chloroflexi bacterium]|nr:MBL fold metallo-hydrolase [Chloroflexota bacterium]
MDITWYGLSCFRLSERGRPSIVTDPFHDNLGLGALKLKSDIVTMSCAEPEHNYIEAVKGQPFVISGPGEYEIGGVFITGLALHDGQASPPRPNVAYHFNYDNLTALHLGDATYVPDQSVLQDFGQVNVLLLPVGGGHSLTAAQAADVVALIEPHFVIPMHYALPELDLGLEPVEKFLKALGISKVHDAETLKLTASDLPEQTQVAVLQPQR